MAILNRIVCAGVALTIVGNVVALTFPDCVNGPLRNNTVCNPSAAPAERAAGLVAAMTLNEKLANLVDKSVGASRIGLPAYEWWSEALHGVAFSPGVNFSGSKNFSSATSFPTPITLSAAFDDVLVEEVASIIGSEARAFANAGNAGLDFWTPNINPFKDPRWGRGLETPGEDPLRIVNYVKHLIKGLQGTKDTRQIIATCKHFAAYDLERWNGVMRYAFDAIVSMQDLVEYYLPPFRQCATDSNVGSIMCSYNSINGTPACANSYLMQTVLREHWNWTGENQYVVSDCNAVHNIYADHHFVQTAAQAAGLALSAGTDNVCEADNKLTDTVGAFNQSLLSQEVIDRSLRRQYEGLVRTGYFDPADKDPYRELGWKDVNTLKAESLAKQAATDGMVLLKNDGTLPLQLKANQSVAVIGFWANDTHSKMLGNYNGRPPSYHTPLSAAHQLNLTVNYANGPINNTGNYSTAIKAAQSSDVILYFGGIDTSIESEDRDRTDISWPGPQLSLLQTLHTLGKPLVVVQLGTQIDNTPLLTNEAVNAILWAGYPGMLGGLAIFDILTGISAPAGRLPITQYPASYTDAVPMTDMSLRPSSANPGRTYKWFDDAVQPFGFGLHYTDFEITVEEGSEDRMKRTSPVYQINASLANCAEKYINNCAFTPPPVSVTNTGTTASDYVLLAFITTKEGPSPQALKSLAAYQRVRDIKPGEKRNVQLAMTWGALTRVDEIGDSRIYEGAYCLVFGVDGAEKTHEYCFELSDGDVLIDKWPQPVGNQTVGKGSASRSGSWTKAGREE